MGRTVVVLVCIFATLWPGDMRAANLGLGLGYVLGDCDLIENSKSHACFRGGRAELSWGLFLREKGSDVNLNSVDSYWSPFRLGMRGFSFDTGHRAGDAVAVVALILLTALVFGFVWLFAVLFSQRIKMGFYFSEDYLASRWSKTADHDLKSYNVQRLGFFTGFYPFARFDLQLHVGIAHSWAQIDVSKSGERDRYRLRGISTKAGLGYVPASESGFFALYEFENTFYNRATLGSYLDDQAKNNLPRVSQTGTLMGGWMLAW